MLAMVNMVFGHRNEAQAQYMGRFSEPMIKMERFRAAMAPWTAAERL
jgi:hypothetical protein